MSDFSQLQCHPIAATALGQADAPALTSWVANTESVSRGLVSASVLPPVRQVLRLATEAAHERLHRHAGFAAIKSATIGLADYRDLVVRLYGFYQPFEVAVGAERGRSAWLADDVRALGVTDPLHAVPKCFYVPRLADAHSRLGALYVAEGAALGGRELARGLDGLLGQDAVEGRRFFVGRGDATGPAWKDYLARLLAASAEPSARPAIVRGAVETFAAFESWLEGWRVSAHE